MKLTDIVVLRMPGLGCTGPDAHYATVGTNITAFSGFTYLWNHPGHTDPPVGSQCVIRILSQEFCRRS